jgi:sugar phosphate isomerase/epimerase
MAAGVEGGEALLRAAAVDLKRAGGDEDEVEGAGKSGRGVRDGGLVGQVEAVAAARQAGDLGTARLERRGQGGADPAGVADDQGAHGSSPCADALMNRSEPRVHATMRLYLPRQGAIVPRMSWTQWIIAMSERRGRARSAAKRPLSAPGVGARAQGAPGSRRKTPHASGRTAMNDIPRQDRVLIFDTTLRDGEQSPGATMTLEEKLQIATLLDEMGVDIIEAGFPIASDGDFEAVGEIAKLAKEAVVCGLAPRELRRHRPLLGGGPARAAAAHHTFIGTSPLHREFQVRLDKEAMAERIHATVSHARNLCDDVQWSPMDATRTEPDYLARVCEIAIKAGATTINIPDTVGYTAPREARGSSATCWSGCRGWTRSRSPRIATTTSAWRRRTRWPRSRRGRGRSSARSTAWASGRGTRRSRRS